MTGNEPAEGEPDACGATPLAGTPWRAVLVDLVLVAAWVGVVSFGWGAFRWPRWAYYVVVFGGIVAYSLTAGPWATPDGD